MNEEHMVAERAEKIVTDYNYVMQSKVFNESTVVFICGLYQSLPLLDWLIKLKCSKGWILLKLLAIIAMCWASNMETQSMSCWVEKFKNKNLEFVLEPLALFNEPTCEFFEKFHAHNTEA